VTYLKGSASIRPLAAVLLAAAVAGASACRKAPPLTAGSAASGDTRKIADFYASFMDEAAIESKGIAPLKPQFDAIAAMETRIS
jgi:hypothetical protein